MTLAHDLERFEQRTGLHFRNRDLLQEAMTHRSYVNEHDEPGLVHNERLEFLGDSVLGFVVADELFRRFPHLAEGELTRLRASLVRTESLASLAQTCGIDDTLRMGRGEEASGGRRRANNLCNAFEALVGALFTDQGLDALRAFVLPLLEQVLQQVLADQLAKDARSLFQEWSQATHNQTPHYRTVSESGPDHEKVFTVEAMVGEMVVGVGAGRSKQSAAQAAARNALSNVQSAE